MEVDPFLCLIPFATVTQNTEHTSGPTAGNLALGNMFGSSRLTVKWARFVIFLFLFVCLLEAGLPECKLLLQINLFGELEYLLVALV